MSYLVLSYILLLDHQCELGHQPDPKGDNLTHSNIDTEVLYSVTFLGGCKSQGSFKYQKPIHVYCPYLHHDFGSHICSKVVGGSSRVPSCSIRRIMRDSGAMFLA
eukprot:3257920-Ditylum_brightwellii.AAC.1